MQSRVKVSSLWTQGAGKIILLSVLVGIFAAFGAIIFEFLVEGAKYLFLGKIAEFVPQGPHGESHMLPKLTHNTETSMWLLFLPAIGGLMSGLLIWKFAPEAKGHGTDGVIDAYHHKRGIIRPIVPLVKAITSAITIGTGGSAGKEGPIAQIAAGIASVMGQKLKLSPKHIRILTIAGLAAGVGAVFRAPLAAGIFAIEVLYREMEFDRDVFMPCLIASIMAYGVFTSIMGHGVLFSTPQLSFDNFYELLPYTVVALVVVLGARLFIWFFYKTEDLFSKMPFPMWIKPVIGGVCVGFVGYYAPNTLAESYGILQSALHGKEVVWMLLLVAFGKMFTTSLTIGSGGSGGVFGPSIVIGGLFGGAVYYLFEGYIDAPPAAFVIVGMAGFFSAAANTPISTIIMVSEMTGSYSLLVPTMWVATISYILGRGATLYNKQLENHFDAPEEMGEMMSEILDRMSVGGACKRYDEIHSVRESQSISELDELMLLDQHQFAVVNEQKELIGVVDRQTLRYTRKARTGSDHLLVSDIMVRPITLKSSDSLRSALQHMVTFDMDQLFVVENNIPVSYLRKQDIMMAYDQRMHGMETQKSTRKKVKNSYDIDLKKVFYNVPSQSKSELLNFFAKVIAEDIEGDVIKVKKSLVAREELGSTAMGGGIAFPHPKEREEFFGEGGVSIIVLKEGIDFGAYDKEPVRLFFLFWSNDGQKHIENLAEMARLCTNEEFLRALDNQLEFEELQNLIVDLKKQS